MVTSLRMRLYGGEEAQLLVVVRIRLVWEVISEIRLRLDKMALPSARTMHPNMLLSSCGRSGHE